MSKIKQAGIFVLGLALSFALIPVSTYAQTAIQPPVTEARCTIARERITTHIANITTLQTDRATLQTSITNRINAYITTATDAGYPDISELTTARDSVTKAISTYTIQAAAYKTALNKVESTPCGEGTGEFVIAVNSARTELINLRTKSAAVKTAVKQEAVPALYDYAAWLKTATSDTKENQ
ncbi:MAG: hypothetical protein JWO54_471 [Candidatus Saccharibacteria bacterium]|nr:hypothetical protein [Candidatus Saccharibacteria bacterium]